MLLVNTILLIFIGLLVLWTIFYVQKQRNAREDVIRNQWSETLSDNTRLINDIIGSINQRLDGITKQVGDRLEGATKVVSQVQKDLGRLEESNRQIFEVGKNIATLQELLRPPKLRGELGQLLLENLLSQIMTKDFFSLQYKFKSGEMVDAVIKIGNRLIPIDAKFPMESFKRYIEEVNDADKKILKKDFVKTVKIHIDDIASKYILPDEGTYEFALMYIPAENVYYETIIKDESFPEDKSIFQYMLSKKVILVSPNTFYAYLLVITYGLRGMEIEKSVGQILQNLMTLKEDFIKFKQAFQLVGRHLKDSKDRYGDAEDHLEKFEDKLERIEMQKPPQKQISNQ